MVLVQQLVSNEPHPLAERDPYVRVGAVVQDMLRQAITVPTRRPPSIWLEEIDRDEVVLRITATPINPSDGAKLAEQVLSVTRGTFEFEHAGEQPDEKSRVPHGHA